MTFETRQKLVNLTKKLGVYRLGYYGALVYDSLHHQKVQFQAKRRANGWIDKRYEHLLQCKDIHHGEKCFIVATGPSLTVADVEMLKGQYTFSVNTIVKLYSQTDWRPTYYVIVDHLVFSTLKNNEEFKKMDGYFVGDFKTWELSLPPHAKLLPYDMMDHMHSMPSPRQSFQTQFSDNAYAVLYDGATVVYAVLQLAVYMGFQEIYLLGCDCDYSGEKMHFVEYLPPEYAKSANSNGNPYNANVYHMFLAYQEARKYADAHGIKIYNATRGGKLEIFERVSLEEAVKG